jgi:hypothetical protein
MSDSRAAYKPSGAPSKAWSLSLSQRGDVFSICSLLYRLLIANRLSEDLWRARSPQGSRADMSRAGHSSCSPK